MRMHEEGAAIEANYDKVDQADGSYRVGCGRCRRPEVCERKADSRGNSLWNQGGNRCVEDWIFDDTLRPISPKCCSHRQSKTVQHWHDMCLINVCISSFIIDDGGNITRTKAFIFICNSIEKHSRRVWIDDDSSPILMVIYCFRDLDWVVPEGI